ncbi:hypothetical protein QJQ45_019871 [Haematococcus lacustris]|nr:hypothetical protein QJQ45_019871 [Haematococcus lacustris]
MGAHASVHVSSGLDRAGKAAHLGSCRQGDALRAVTPLHRLHFVRNNALRWTLCLAARSSSTSEAQLWALRRQRHSELDDDDDDCFNIPFSPDRELSTDALLEHMEPSRQTDPSVQSTAADQADIQNQTKQTKQPSAASAYPTQPTLPQEANNFVLQNQSSRPIPHSMQRQQQERYPPRPQQRHQHQHVQFRRHYMAAGRYGRSQLASPQLSPHPNLKAAGSSSQSDSDELIGFTQMTRYISRCSSFHQLLCVWEQQGKLFNHVHVACLINRLAHNRHGWAQTKEEVWDWEDVHAFLCKLDLEVVRCLSYFTSREVANVMWAWGRLGHQPSPLTWRRMSHSICCNGGALLRDRHVTAQTLANLTWGLTALHIDDEPTWQAVLSAVRARLKAAGAAGSGQDAGKGQGTGWVDQAAGQRGSWGHDSGSREGAAAAAWRHSRGADQLASRSPDLLLPSTPKLQGPAHQLQPQVATASHDRSNSSSRSRQGGVGQQQAGAAPALVFTPMDLSNLAWSLAKAGRYDPVIFTELCRQAEASLLDFKANELSNLLWACAQCQHPCPSLFSASIPSIRALLRTWKPQALTNTLWAYARAGCHSPRVFAPLAHHALLSIDSLNPNQLSKIAWAMATAGQAHVDFLEAAMAQAQQQREGWTTQALSRFLWALVTMEAGGQTVLHCLAGEVLRQLWSQFEGGLPHQPAQDPASTPESEAGAVAVVVSESDVDSDLRQQAGLTAAPPTPGRPPAWLHPTCSPSAPLDLAHTLWALAWSGHYSQALFEQAASLCTRHPHVFFARPADMASIMWPFGYARHYDPALYSVAAAMLEQRPEQHGLSLAQTAALLVPLAQMQHACPAACRQVAESLKLSLAQQSSEASFATLSSLLWSLMLLGYLDTALLQAAFSRVHWLWEQHLGRVAGRQRREAEEDSRETMPMLPMPKTGEIAGRHISQMFHIYLWLKDQPDPEAVKVADSLPRDFREHALKVWRQQTTEKQVISDYQQKVLQALSDMGLEPQIERKTRDWLFSIDVCLKLGDVLVAVEVNGPLHYSASLPWRPTGKKLLRNAFLARRGYRVVDVAWWQWERVAVDQDRAQQYLRDLLEDAVVTPLDQDHWAAGAGLHGS